MAWMKNWPFKVQRAEEEGQGGTATTTGTSERHGAIREHLDAPTPVGHLAAGDRRAAPEPLVSLLKAA